MGIDRSGWPPGPWDHESDFEQFVCRSYHCMMVRNRTGVWCGYVAVPKSHPWWGMHWDSELPDVTSGQHCLFEEQRAYNINSYVNVHGGLTFAGTHPNGGKRWWFGFDCAHASDLVPELVKHGLAGMTSYDVYRDAVYVELEVKRLASQLRQVA